jgi:hypothetical protein
MMRLFCLNLPITAQRDATTATVTAADGLNLRKRKQREGGMHFVRLNLFYACVFILCVRKKVSKLT